MFYKIPYESYNQHISHEDKPSNYFHSLLHPITIKSQFHDLYHALIQVLINIMFSNHFANTNQIIHYYL